MIELYRTIWRVTGRQQVLLIALSMLISVLAAAPLKFQQLVINGLVYGGDVRGLGWLCGGFLGVVLLSAALKFALNYRLAILGERIVMLIRERLYANYVADAAVGTADLPRRGTLVTMLSAEAEAVGAFAGAAIATPLMQIGTLISVIRLHPGEPALARHAGPGRRRAAGGDRGALQSRINHRVRERVQSLRDASDRISDSDLARVEDAVVADFREVFETRRRIFLLKLSSKFALSVLSALGVVGVLFLGGWLVLHGRSDVGTVVASLTGLSRIEGPWRDLVAFFRTASTIRVKFAMLRPSVVPR